MTIRIVLVDDHTVFREAFRAVLSNQPDLEVVGEASEGRAVLELIKRARPDVMVVDVTLPGITGITVTRDVVASGASTRVLVLTMHKGIDFVSEALAAGACGCALKEQEARSVIDAIRQVAEGRTYLSPLLPRDVLEELLDRQRGASVRMGPLGELSTREREVFDLIVLGYSNQGVASELSISVKTVETHRCSINRKLRIHSAADLIRFAASRGLLPTES